MPSRKSDEMSTPADDSYERRREQVRKAQKTHRERKATYVKSLEIEVAELRKRNAELVAECTASENVIRRLRETLVGRNSILPIDNVDVTGEKRPTGDLALCSMGNTTFPNQRLELNYPSCESTKAIEPSSTPIDNKDTAINFILSLEQPCLYHHRIPSPELLMMGSIGGTGHSSMLSSIVMDRAPSFSFNPLSFGYPPNVEWHTPTVELEQLLRTSEQLGLDTELTPIQIWNNVKQHPNFGSLSISRLNLLKDRLFPLVKCYGFGAVVLRSEFEDALEEVLKEVF